MKGVNLKKMGAILAGTAILAGSVAFAGQTMYENVELVNAQGQPVAKVVVGSNAALSDALSAARIAQTLANNAFVEKTYTAQVEGTDALSCGVDSGEATCTVTDSSVTLEVTVPGVAGTAVHEFGLLIGETTDTDLGDRDTTNDGLTKTTGLLKDEANPFQDQEGATLAGIDVQQATYNAVAITENDLDAFSKMTVTSSKYASKEEYQRFYVEGKAKFSEAEEEVFFDGTSAVYQLVFGPGDEGLPLCPGDDNMNISACDPSDALDTARYSINFLGANWIVSEANLVADGSGNAVTKKQIYLATDGFTLKLAKESQYGIVNVGESLEAEGVKVVLDDISRNENDNNPAIVSIYDNNDNLLAQDQIEPGQTKEITYSGGSVKVKVYQTAPGILLTSKWAEMAVLKDEIELKAGDTFLDDDDKDSEWTVDFGLVNKNAGNDDDAEATHLRSIYVWTDSDAFDDVNGDVNGVGEGDVLPVIDVEGYTGYELKNNGLSDSNVDTFQVKLIKGANIDDKTVNDPMGIIPDANDKVDITDYIKITSDQDNAFESGSYDGKEIWIAYDDKGAAGLDAGDSVFVLLKDTDENPEFIAIANVTLDAAVADLDTSLTYDYAGDDGNIHITYDEIAAPGPYADVVQINLTENIGEVGGTEDNGNFTFEWNITAQKIYDDASLANPDDEQVNYTVPGNFPTDVGYDSPSGTYDTGFISPRGSVFKSASSTERTIEIPANVRTLQMVFQPSESAVESANAQVVGPLSEGETATVGSTTITVKSIDVTATPTVGGAGAAGAVQGVDQLSAVIVSSDGAEKVTELTAVTPVAVSENLVVLDSDAADVGTKIVVGGPGANSVAADVFATAGLELSPENNVLVKAVDEKTVVVAGYTAEDTAAAVDQFLAALSA